MMVWKSRSAPDIAHIIISHNDDYATQRLGLSMAKRFAIQADF